MTHMLLPVGKEAKVVERGDMEGSYPSFCYSAADPFSALVRELAATSTGGKAAEREGRLLWKRKSSTYWCEKIVIFFFFCMYVGTHTYTQ